MNGALWINTWPALRNAVAIFRPAFRHCVTQLRDQTAKLP
jgi:hypothetical protein